MPALRPCLLLAALLAAAAPASAAEESQQEGWSFSFTPYFWATWMDATLTTPSGIQLETATDLSELIDSLNFALQGAGEVRYDRFSFVLDLTYANLTSRQDTPQGVLFSEAVIDTTEWIVNGVAGYRFYRDRVGYIDAMAGVRLFIVDNDIELKPGVLPKQEFDSKSTTVSPILGMRGHIDIADGFGVSGYFDVGGFGLGANFTWQALATIDYEMWDNAYLRAGYRHLGISYDDNGSSTTMNMSGPIVGVTFRF
jgi:hypothetical protein